MVTAGDNPRIIIKIAIFNAGGVVLPRPSAAHTSAALGQQKKCIGCESDALI